MATVYDGMWEKLNLDLDAHTGLLEVLGKLYGDIYLSQPYTRSLQGGKSSECRQDPRARHRNDYSMEDVEQLKTLVEAFLEMVRQRFPCEPETMAQRR